MTSRHNYLTSQHKYLASQHKDLTGRHNYLTSDGRNMPPYQYDLSLPVKSSFKEIDMNSLYPLFLYTTFSQNWLCFSEEYTKFENMTTTLITNGDKQQTHFDQ